MTDEVLQSRRAQSSTLAKKQKEPTVKEAKQHHSPDHYFDKAIHRMAHRMPAKSKPKPLQTVNHNTAGNTAGKAVKRSVSAQPTRPGTSNRVTRRAAAVRAR